VTHSFAVDVVPPARGAASSGCTAPAAVRNQNAGRIHAGDAGTVSDEENDVRTWLALSWTKALSAAAAMIRTSVLCMEWLRPW